MSYCVYLFKEITRNTVHKSIFMFICMLDIFSLSIFGVLFLQKVSWMGRQATANEMLARSKMSASALAVQPVGKDN